MPCACFVKKNRFNIDKHCLFALIFICAYNNNGKQHSPLTHSIVSSCKQQASNKQHHNGKQQATMAHSIMTSTKQQTIHTMTSASMYVCSMCMHVLHVCVCVCMCCACQLCTCACVCLCMQYLCVECLCMLVCLCACACVSVCVFVLAPSWTLQNGKCMSSAIGSKCLQKGQLRCQHQNKSCACQLCTMTHCSTVGTSKRANSSTHLLDCIVTIHNEVWSAGKQPWLPIPGPTYLCHAGDASNEVGVL